MEEACGAESDCEWEAGGTANKCTMAPTCDDVTSSTCNLCDSDEDACEEFNGCSYNVVDNECVATPTTTTCSDYNELPVACLARSECNAYNSSSNVCEASLSVDVSGAVTCNALDDYEAACNDVMAGSGKGANDLGCAFNTNTPGCVDVAAFVAGSTTCSSLNYIEKSCEAESTCHFTGSTCIDNVECSAADNSSCWACNDDESACDGVTGCAYNSDDDECKVKPTVTDSSDCDDLNGFAHACDNNSECGHYNYKNDRCYSESPAYSDDCTVLEGYMAACEDESDCEYNSGNNECTKKSSGGGGSGGSGNSSASNLAVSALLAFVLALLL